MRMKNQSNPPRFYLTAFAGVLVFIGLILLYVREFAVFYNTIGVQRLVAGSFVVGALAAGGLAYALRRRLTPWGKHVPEVLLIAVFTLLFAPLFGSLLNRTGAPVTNQSFDFFSEKPYLASSYGLLKGEKIKPTGYFLEVREGERLMRFKYKRQAYYPNTQPGDPILLPVQKGWFGFRVMRLR